jgi:hypothetical protein
MYNDINTDKLQQLYAVYVTLDTFWQSSGVEIHNIHS